LFYERPRSKDGLDSACKSCVKLRNLKYYKSDPDRSRRFSKNWRESNPDKVKEKSIKYRFGLTLSEYDAMLMEGCAVCKSFDRLCIDHDHNCCPGARSCGKCIRGVLCSRHNSAEGFFSGIDEVLALADYLSQFEDVLGVNN
jgi:hypothetical protein